MTGSRILGADQRWFQRGVKESIFIHAIKPSLNRDGGRFNLSPIWHNIVGERIGKGAHAQSSKVLVASLQHQSEATFEVNRAGVPAESY